MKSFRLWFVLLALLTSATLGPAVRADEDEDPIKHVMRITLRDTAQGLEFLAENLQGTDITVQLDLNHAKNATSDPAMPTQFILLGHETRTVAKLSRKDPAHPLPHPGYLWHWCYGRNDATHKSDVVYELPFARGASYKIVQGFHGSFSHTGQDDFALDFGMPEDSPVLACRGGQVVFTCSRFSQGAPKEYFRNRVNTVRIKHDDGTLGEYCHFRLDGVVVHEGDRVTTGQLLGYAGHTGYAAGPHLHFLVYRAVDAFHREGYPIMFHAQEVEPSWVKHTLRRLGFAASDEPVVLEEGQSYARPDQLKP